MQFMNNGKMGQFILEILLKDIFGQKENLF
jgi:hypothetical protein